MASDGRRGLTATGLAAGCKMRSHVAAKKALLVSGRPPSCHSCRGPSSGVFSAFCGDVCETRSAVYYGVVAPSWSGPTEGSHVVATNSDRPQVVVMRGGRRRLSARGTV